MDTTFLNLLAEVKPPSTWFPTDASASNQVDGLAYFILIICGIFLVFNAGLMVFFAVRYRQQKKQDTATGATHNTALEVFWSVIPAFILAIIFIWGFRGFLVQATPPDNSYDIMVTGKKWEWIFTYPNGISARGEGSDYAALHVPADQPVRLTLQSQDVLHSVFIPQLRVKKDVVPGRFNQMWFEAHFDEKTAEAVELPTEDGGTVEVKRNTYDLFCTEYCGTNHSTMITKVYIYQPDDYEKWYASMALVSPDKNMILHGQQLYDQKCKTCHSLDGSGTAQYPTWEGLYGTTNHATSVGPKTVDDLYIIESIRNPGAALAPKPGGGTYPGGMNSFPELSDRDIRSIIEFMKTASDKVDADEDLIYGDLNNDGTLKGEAEGEEGGPEVETEGDDAPEGGAEAETDAAQ
ncbi:MAG: c-type cytochrome [Phycisphaeraceae bacterium]|nr:c-type cytochrome [Phycisphaeraceae bacterium]